MTTPLRVIGLVDGFNLYHSLQDDPGHKWLDLGKLLTGLLHCYPSPAKLVDIHYFTALPFYLQQTNPGRLSRHQIYLRALSARRNPSVTTYLGEIRQHQLEVAIPGGKTWTKVWREKGDRYRPRRDTFRVGCRGFIRRRYHRIRRLGLRAACEGIPKDAPWQRLALRLPAPSPEQ